MSGKSFYRKGFTQMTPNGLDAAGSPFLPEKSLAYTLWNDFKNNGFSVIDSDNADLTKATAIILRPSLAVDPLWNDNPWQIYFKIKNVQPVIEQNNLGADYAVTDPRGLYFRIGTPAQLPNVANVASGLKEFPIMPETFNVFFPNDTNLGVDYRFPRLSVRHPAAYALTIVERGFVLGVWCQDLTEDLSKMGVMCVQRGVGCDGAMITTGQRPLYMVTNISPTGSNLTQSQYENIDGPRNNWYYSIVREFDTSVMSPSFTTFPSETQGYPASIRGLYYNSNQISDSNEVLGQSLNYFPTQWKTPVTTDTGEYILLFPFGLCTRRFAFSDEIDLIAVSKADAYQVEQAVPITVYGDQRTYSAWCSNNQSFAINYDSGVRVFFMTGSTTAGFSLNS